MRPAHPWHSMYFEGRPLEMKYFFLFFFRLLFRKKGPQKMWFWADNINRNASNENIYDKHTKWSVGSSPASLIKHHHPPYHSLLFHRLGPYVNINNLHRILSLSHISVHANLFIYGDWNGAGVVMHLIFEFV